MIQEFKNYLTKEQCQKMIEACEKTLEPSTVLGDNSSGYRIADGTWFKKDSEFGFYSDKVVETTGISKENQEDIHIVRYNIGGRYMNHHDFFHMNQDYTEAEMAKGGQRVKTTLVYLNDGFEGGETEFPNLGIKVTPEAGKMVCWDNVKSNGETDDDSLHAGLSVISGVKYVAIIWIREGKFTG